MHESQRQSRRGSTTRLIIEPEIAQTNNSKLKGKSSESIQRNCYGDSVVSHRYNTRLSARFSPNLLDVSGNGSVLSGADDSSMSLRTGVGVGATHLNPCSDPNFFSYGRFTKYGLIFILICGIGVLLQSVLAKYHKTIDLESDLIDVKTLMSEMKTNMESIMKTRDETSKVLEDIHQLFHKLENRESEIGRKSLGPEFERISEEGAEADGRGVEGAIETALQRYDADKIATPDYALESSGAEILATPNTKNYNIDDSVTLFGWKLCSNSRGASVILQPSVMPGQCWAFCGNSGSVVIKLIAEIVVTAVTLEHIPKQISPSNDISSAPKEIAVYGINEENHEIKLGRFTYDSEGNPIQTFNVDTEENANSFYLVKIDFLSNHGNPHYTCVYRVRVHGDVKGGNNRANAN